MRTDLLIGGLVAVAIACLSLAAGPGVFVTPEVAVVHLLAAVPLGCVLAVRVGGDATAVVFAVMIGVVTAAAVWAGVFSAGWLGDGFILAAAARTLVAVSVVAPWVVAGAAWAGRPPAAVYRPLVASAVAVAALVPAAFVVRHTDARATELADLEQRGRVARAAEVAAELDALGREELPAADRSATRRSVPAVRAELEAQVTKLERAVARDAVADDAVIARAGQLAQLNRLAEAEAAVRPLADRSPAAALLLAAVLQDERRFDESSRWYEAALDRRRPLLVPGVEKAALGLAAVAGLPAGVTADEPLTAAVARAPDDCRRAFEGLAFNARQQHRFADGERWYAEAVATLPAMRPHFEFQLGMHFTAADRPAAAIEHFRTAAALAPKQFGPAAAARIATLRRDTLGCLLAPAAPPGGPTVGR